MKIKFKGGSTECFSIVSGPYTAVILPEKEYEADDVEGKYFRFRDENGKEVYFDPSNFDIVK